MQLPLYIKKYPKFWSYISVLRNAYGNALYPFIFLTEEAFKNLQSINPDTRYIALLKHEEKHRERQKQMDPVKYFLLIYAILGSDSTRNLLHTRLQCRNLREKI